MKYLSIFIRVALLASTGAIVRVPVKWAWWIWENQSMYNHNKAQQSKNRVHISWDILYLNIQSSPCGITHFEGNPPEGLYLPRVSMAGRALLAGYHRFVIVYSMVFTFAFCTSIVLGVIICWLYYPNGWQTITWWSLQCPQIYRSRIFPLFAYLYNEDPCIRKGSLYIEAIKGHICTILFPGDHGLSLFASGIGHGSIGHGDRR